MKTTDLSTIMRNAWRFRHITGVAFSECLKTAWANFKLKQKMLKGIVKFYYRKVDGTIREAYGTLKSELLPEASTSTEPKRATNDTVFTYFDTEKQQYRSCKKLNIISQ